MDKKIFEKAKNKIVETFDQNDDGKFDEKDMTIISEARKKNKLKKQRIADLKKLQPIFLEDIQAEDFVLNKFIRVAHKDQMHKDNELCANSIGHYTGHGKNKFITIYNNKLSKFGISLYPHANCEFYFVDPCNQKRYIDIDNYFSYLKSMRVSELQKIAQDLGAKYFKITYKEKKVSLTKRQADITAHVNVKGKGSANTKVNRNFEENSFTAINIEAENTFPGGKPKKPKIKYLQYDPIVNNLIDMRLYETSPLGKQKITIEFQNTCGMKERDAVKVDAALKVCNASGNTKLTNEVQNEQRRIFEYEIEFPK